MTNPVQSCGAWGRLPKCILRDAFSCVVLCNNIICRIHSGEVLPVDASGQTEATPFMRLAQSGRFTLLLPSECISQHGSQTFYLVRNAKAFSKRAFSYAYVGYLNNPVTRGRAAGATAILLAPYSSGFNVFTVHQK